jgi:RHS repeat-associated protein
MSFSYNAGSQINNSGFGYDWQGRLEFWGGGHTYAWNGASQLKNADGVSLDYDGWNELMTRASSGTSTRYYYNHALGDHRIAGEYNVTTSQYTRYFAWAPNGPLLFTVDPLTGSVSYPHYDRNGSTIALTDSTGKITDAYAYGLTGGLLSHTGSISQPYTYLGAHAVYYEPSANLYNFGARWYSPTLGSFLTPDTSWPQPDNPQSTPYSYANNNPEKYFNAGGFGAQPLGGSFTSRRAVVESPRISIRSLSAIQSPRGFNAGDFLRTYDPAQSLNGNFASARNADSPFSAILARGILPNSHSDCCCCCCCCCCCDCCCGGGGLFTSARLNLIGYSHGGTYSPLRQTSYARYISLAEAYRKFQNVRLLPLFPTYMQPAMLPGTVSPVEAARGTGELQQRNFGNFSLGFSARYGF